MTSPRSIDLNADLGEGMPWDVALLALVTSANVSCGAHAGDPAAISATLAEATRRGVAIGAHPSWPDRPNFGRAERLATSEEVEALVVGQVETLRALASGVGGVVRYIKPHGALYNQAMAEPDGSSPIGLGLLAAAARLGLPLMGLPATPLERLAGRAGVRYLREGFPDRGLTPDGRLIPRGQPGALLEGVDAVVAQALALAARPDLDSLCLHGDSPEALARAVAIRSTFDRAGFEVRSSIYHAC